MEGEYFIQQYLIKEIEHCEKIQRESVTAHWPANNLDNILKYLRYELKGRFYDAKPSILESENAALKATLAERDERDRWRSVETEPPTESGYYEINTSDLFAYFSNSPNAVSKWVVWGMNGSEEPINKPTHWRPLRTDRPIL